MEKPGSRLQRERWHADPGLCTAELFLRRTLHSMTRNIRGLVFAVIVISLCHFCKEAYATTYTAASCNESDVQAAIARATHDGDVVSIPAGTCTWTSTLSVTIPNSLTIQGAGAISAVGG